MNEGDIVPALREPPRTAEIKKQWYWLWAVLVNSIVYNLMRGSLLTRLPSSLSPALLQRDQHVISVLPRE